MFMLYLVPIIVFIAFIVGYLIKKYNSEEKELQNKYYIYFEKFTLFLLIITIIITSYSSSYWFYIFLITGIVLGYFFKESSLYVGLSLLTLNMYISIFACLYNIVIGNKYLIKNLILFFIPFLLLLFSQDWNSLVVLSAGAMLPKLFYNLKSM